MRFEFALYGSDHPQVNTESAIESIANLSPGCKTLRLARTTTQRIEACVWCDEVEQGNVFLRSLDDFGILHRKSEDLEGEGEGTNEGA